MQKKLFTLALGALLFGGSLAAVAATQDPHRTSQAPCCCCDNDHPCGDACRDKPCCDHCPNQKAQ